MTNVNHDMTRHALRIAEAQAADWHRVFESERDKPNARLSKIILNDIAERAECWSRIARGFRANILGVPCL